MSLRSPAISSSSKSDPSLLVDLLPRDNFIVNTKLMTIPEWIKFAGINLRGQAYSLRKHEYLQAILADRHPNQTFRKGAQVGISTLILIKSLYVAEHLGKKVVYYFQNDAAVDDFSSDRAEPMIQQSLYLAQRVNTTNRVRLRQVGPGSVYFRGLYTRGQAKSIDCDMVCLDELDEAKESNVQFSTDRLLHSDLGWVMALSQPSVPGFGIDKRFQETDQRHWNLICPSCGTRNILELDFPENFIEIAPRQRKTHPEGATHYRGCKKCKTRLNPAAGEWIPRYPDRTLYRGYHLSQLYSQIKTPEAPNVATKVMAEWELKRRSQSGLENFTISFLGMPFSGGNARVTDALLDFMEGGYGFSFKEFGCFMGVDQGDVLSIVLGIVTGNSFKVVFCEETESWKRLDYLMEHFGVHYCVIDAQPNKYTAKAFASRYPGRVSIQYFGAKETKTGEEPHEDGFIIPTISVDRTETLDAMIDRMEAGLVEIPRRSKCQGKALANVEDLRRHLKQLISKNELMANGLMKKVYIRGNGVENHYGMALNSAFVAAFELGIKAPGPMVMPIWKQFANA